MEEERTRNIMNIVSKIQVFFLMSNHVGLTQYINFKAVSQPNTDCTGLLSV